MIGGILTSVLLIGLLSGWLFLQQPAMVFYPYAELSQTPEAWDLEYEDVTLETADGEHLHGWYIPAQGSDKYLLFFHGNAGNISHRGDSVAIFHRLGLSVFIFDYRGYGQSEGKPNETGLYEDARGAWRYLVEKRGLSARNIVVFGRSLGSVVAANLASEVQPGALILESTFSSAKDMAKAIFPVLSHITVMRYEFNAVDSIKQVTSPLLVVHSPDDEIIPYYLGEKVYRAANEPKQLYKLRGDHNSGFILSQPEYEAVLGEFIDAFVPKGKLHGK